MKYYIGCSGWSYSSWQGPFYPKEIENSWWLPYYSKIFDYVEIDSSFYRVPNQFMARNWYNKTPDSFRFTAKFPKAITHDRRLKDVDEEQLKYFFDSMLELKEKLLALLIQLPPSIQIVEGLEALRNIIPYLDKEFTYAVEVRNRSWFQDLAYNFFSDNNLCLVWSQLAEIRTPPIVTSDLVYIRFIGDRSIHEKDFGRIQIDRVKEMQRVARNFNKAMDNNRGDVNLAIVAANNHYAGFGPATANIFRRMLGLEEMRWEGVEIKYDDIFKGKKMDQGAQKIKHGVRQIKEKQTSLFDFAAGDNNDSDDGK